MTTPADLIEHYSTRAFLTRMAALASVGAVLGANVAWQRDQISPAVLGFGLLLVVFCLAELNRRFTYSYLSACRAAAGLDSKSSNDPPKSAEMLQWADFVSMNEGPWTNKDRDGTLERYLRIANRFLLSWSTYFPGLLAGVYLASDGGYSKSGFALGFALVAWWLWNSIWPRDPRQFRKDVSFEKAEFQGIEQTKPLLKRYTFWLWLAVAFQLLTGVIHSLSLFITRDPATLNATERQLFYLMTEYKADMGAGIHRSAGQLFKALSSCFSLLCLLGALTNIYLLRKRVAAGLVKGLTGIQLLVFGICFGVMAALTFLPPIVLSGLVFLFLAIAYFTNPGKSVSRD